MIIYEKVLQKAVDVALIAVYFNMEIFGKQRKDWYRQENKVSDDLENLNYDTIKRAIIHLKEKGLIFSVKEKLTLPQITQEGLKRLSSILPKYDTKRVWDNRIYLITYDLPINKNKERNKLRSFLKRIGCGMIQKSVWVTPYNPTDLLKQFTQENNLDDLILISSLGKDGTIGSQNITNLFINIYNLRNLNNEYFGFISSVKENNTPKEVLVFNFLSILSKDPQLPFPLLPDWWVGNKAYDIFYKITH